MKSVALKNLISLCFAIKEKFLKGDGVKGNDENMMKSNDRISSTHGSENEGRFFLDDSFNKRPWVKNSLVA